MVMKNPKLIFALEGLHRHTEYLKFSGFEFVFLMRRGIHKVPTSHIQYTKFIEKSQGSNATFHRENPRIVRNIFARCD